MNIIKEIRLKETTYKGNENIENVDLNNVKFVDDNMSNAFRNCYSLNSVTNINENVTNMYGSFACCNNLTDSPIIPSKVDTLAFTFSGCSNLKNISEIPNSVTNMSHTFNECSQLENAPIIPDSVENMSDVFAKCVRLKNVPSISNSVINLKNAFDTCINIKEINLSDCSQFTSLDNTFIECRNLLTINFTNCHSLRDVYDEFNGKGESIFSFRNIKEISFNGCNKLSSLSNVFYDYRYNLTNIYLYNCDELVDMSLTFGHSNVVNVPTVSDNLINMYGTFYDCSFLITTPTIPNSVTDITYAFDGCGRITKTPVIPNNITNLAATFYGCGNLKTAPVVPNNVTNMFSTFYNCNKMINDIYIVSENVVNAYNSFSLTITSYSGSTPIFANKNIYIPFQNNGVYTKTYNEFTKYFSSTSRTNGILLKDLNDIKDNLSDWRNVTLDNGTRLLYEYIGSSSDVTVLPIYTLLNNGSMQESSDMPFINNQTIVNVDLKCVPFVNNDMSYAFSNCINLENVYNLNPYITSMNETFNNCTNLIYVSELPDYTIDMHGTFNNCQRLENAPAIPPRVKILVNTFSECNSLVNAPEIPNGVVDMTNTFYKCNSLVNAPEIPNSVTNIASTFSSCSSLDNVQNIGTSVQCMDNTFRNCTSLTGNIIIQSEKVEITSNCFNRTSLEKDVYIPFKYIITDDLYGWDSSSAISHGYPTRLYTKSENPLIDTEGQVFYEDGTEFTLLNIDTSSANTYINFGYDYVNYTRNSNLDIINGGYTRTYKSFVIDSVYSTETRSDDGVLIKDLNEYNP